MDGLILPISLPYSDADFRMSSYGSLWRNEDLAIVLQALPPRSCSLHISKNGQNGQSLVGCFVMGMVPFRIPFMISTSDARRSIWVRLSDGLRRIISRWNAGGGCFLLTDPSLLR